MKMLLTIILSLGFFKAYGYASAGQKIQETQIKNFHEFFEISEIHPLRMAGGNNSQNMPTNNHPHLLVAQGSAEMVITDPIIRSSHSPPPVRRRELTWDMISRLMTAESAFQSNDLELALEKYMEVALETWDSGIAARTVQIAELLGDKDKIAKATQLQNKADPSNIKASQTLVPFLIQSGNIDGAVDHLKLIIERMPNPSVAEIDPKSHQNIPLPDSKRKFNQLQQSMPSFENTLGAGFKFAINTLSSFLRGEHEETAINTMKQLAAKYEKENVEAQMAMAILLNQAKQFDEVLNIVESVVPFSTGNAQITIFRAKLYNTLKEGQKALDILEKFLRHHPNSKIRLLYTSMLVDMEQYEQAYNEFKELLTRYPDNVMGRYLFGLMLWQTDQLDEAKQQFEQIADSDSGPAADMANYSLGQIAESRKQYDEAIDLYRKVNHSYNIRFNAHIKIAHITAKQDGLPQARNYLYALRPKARNQKQLMDLYIAEASMLADEGQYNEMTVVYRKALIRFPGNLNILNIYTASAQKIQRVDINIIEEYINKILAVDPDNADALNTLGYDLLEFTHRYEEAYELIKHALQIKPDAAHILDSMGWVLFRMGQHQEALTYLERAASLTLPKVHSAVEAHIGEIYWVLKEKDKAREIWNKALETALGDKEYLIKTMKRLDPPSDRKNEKNDLMAP